MSYEIKFSINLYYIFNDLIMQAISGQSRIKAQKKVIFSDMTPIIYRANSINPVIYTNSRRPH